MFLRGVDPRHAAIGFRIPVETGTPPFRLSTTIYHTAALSGKPPDINYD